MTCEHCSRTEVPLRGVPRTHFQCCIGPDRLMDLPHVDLSCGSGTLVFGAGSYEGSNGSQGTKEE